MRLTQRGHDQENPDPDPGPVPHRSPWRFGVPAVCLSAGLLLAATHGVAAGRDIRGSDSPRLVDLVHETQASVDRLGDERDALAARIDTSHGARAGTALEAMQRRIAALAPEAGAVAMHGPGVTVILTDASRDAQGRFPRDAFPDDLVVHQQDIDGVLNALWSAGAEAIAMQDRRIIATSAPRCVGNTLLLNGRTYSPPYTIAAVGDAPALQAALADAPLVRLYKQYVIRFGLGYREQVSSDIDIPGYSGPLRLRYARPAGPLGY
jgi:uncharacterized protein YlxW (UPF0749 family)